LNVHGVNSQPSTVNITDGVTGNDITARKFGKNPVSLVKVHPGLLLKKWGI
jgi:hypothetical protein